MSSFVIKTIGNALNATSYVSPRYASKKAIHLFSKPRKGRYNENQNAIIATAKRTQLSWHDLDISVYVWEGNGPTILLAHGWESNASRWSYLLKDLRAQDYTVIALDAPAHGNSGGKVFNAVLYSEFISETVKYFNPEVLIGHSVGGMASIFCLHNYQSPSVTKLISLRAPAHFDGVFSRYKNMMGYNHRISKGMERLVVERFGKTTDYFSAANFTKDFEIKGLIIHDKKDKIIPYEDALLFSNKFKNSELITTEGFGHSLKDNSLTPKIIDFINR